TLCCGTEREVTVDCPLDCEFLREARRHERPAVMDLEQAPNRDIRITEQFVAEHRELSAFLGRALAEAAFSTPGAVDLDLRDALDGLTRTYRTLQSGLQYESVPTNPVGAALFRHVQHRLAELRQREAEMGGARTRDADVLG